MAPGADRLLSLAAMLGGRGLRGRVLPLAGRRHLLLRLGAGSPRLVLAAHYDRYPGSPGALDNSAACLALAEAAGRLGRGAGPRGLFLLFTDGEEAPASAGPLSQGAYDLGRGLMRALGGACPPVLALDVLGRGESLLLSSASAELLGRAGPGREGGGRAALLPALGRLEALVRRAAGPAGFAPPLRLPLPWSDDLGFTLAGLPSLALSLLPEAEAEAYAAALAGQRAGSRAAAGPDRASLGAAWPPTWSLLHGPGDGLELLEEASLEASVRLVLAIAEALG